MGCKPDMPKIIKTLPVLKWTESLNGYLSRKIGVWMTPLVYVVRANVILPVLENRERSMPHTIKYDYVEADL
eukprot:5072700-Ditylum_brightwellii.AAC.1